MENKRVSMQKQELKVRLKNFNEVALGYTEEEAKSEAARCLNCKNAPCRNGCPIYNRIPEFIREVAMGDFEKAYEIICDKNPLPAVTGRVCPQEKQCEAKCVRGIKGEPLAIGRLERFVADYHNKNVKTEAVFSRDKQKVAVIGGGPSGITCAVKLAEKGYKVTLFEAAEHVGGILYYGIPEFCLPNEIILDLQDRLIQKGIEVETDAVVGKAFTIKDLLDDGYAAAYVAIGANKSRFMNIEGENLLGVYSANEYLYKAKLFKNTVQGRIVKRGDKVVVVGGGNVAIDAARTAIRHTGDVTIIYRRTENELPARKEEVQNAIEEGIKFLFLTTPVKLHADSNGRLNKAECVKMQLGEEDSSGRRSPVVIKNSNFTIDVDCVIMAIGSDANAYTNCFEDCFEVNKYGYPDVGEDLSTEVKGVFAGGDFVCGASTVINAVAYGEKGAEAIDEYLKANFKATVLRKNGKSDTFREIK